MDLSQINQLRLCLLNTMDEIHRVCEKHQITYYIVGGTALGAVRHDGFIPWDTDIDIAMRREDYDRFTKSSNLFLEERYYCAHYENTERWYHPHALVFNTNTMVHWNRSYYKNKADCPIYVDIFPLDYAPGDSDLQVAQEKEVRRKIYLQSRRECIIYQRNGLAERVAKRAYSSFLRFVPDYAFNASLDSTMKKYFTTPTDYLCSMASRYSYKKQLMPDAFYGKGDLYHFEGRLYRGPAMMDAYLSQLYGDYMQWPPEDKRTEYMDYIDCIEFNADTKHILNRMRCMSKIS